jgi:hypothetical protein
MWVHGFICPKVHIHNKTRGWGVQMSPNEREQKLNEHKWGLLKRTAGQARTKALSGNITTTTAGTGAGVGWQQEQWEWR